MRCALCGGEIDSTTKQCTRCGECWGGGNRGIAQAASKETDELPLSAEPAVIERIVLFIKSFLAPVDRALVGCAGKAVAIFNKNTDEHQNRKIVFCFLLAVMAVAVIVPAVCCSACSSDALYGKWIQADTDGSVSIEFAKNGDVAMYVLSNGIEVIYRRGTFSSEGNILNIMYDDGESISLTFSIEKNTAVFTLLSTGESQTYIRK